MLNMSELDTVSEHGWVFLNKDECSQFLRKINQINKSKCFSLLKRNKNWSMKNKFILPNIFFLFSFSINV